MYIHVCVCVCVCMCVCTRTHARTHTHTHMAQAVARYRANSMMRKRGDELESIPASESVLASLSRTSRAAILRYMSVQ